MNVMRDVKSNKKGRFPTKLAHNNLRISHTVNPQPPVFVDAPLSSFKPFDEANNGPTTSMNSESIYSGLERIQPYPSLLKTFQYDANDSMNLQGFMHSVSFQQNYSFRGDASQNSSDDDSYEPSFCGDMVQESPVGDDQQMFKVDNTFEVPSSSRKSFNTTDEDILRVLEKSPSSSSKKFEMFEKENNEFVVEPATFSVSSATKQTPLARQLPTTRVSTISKSNTGTNNSSRTLGKSPRITNAADSDISQCIIAVTEGRGHAMGEVGIAAMDYRRPHIILCQISDTQRYQYSLSKLNIFNFAEALVPNTCEAGASYHRLHDEMLERFPAVTYNYLNRRHFNDSLGLQMIQQYGTLGSESNFLILKDKYYALAAAAALLKYIEYSKNVIFAPRSLKVEYQGSEDTMIIDLDSANRLELVMSLQKGDEKYCLLGAVKHCSTKGGLRLLRANLLQPFTNVDKINNRLDCVAELIEKPAFFNALQVAVGHLKNVENLLTLCMHPPKQGNLKDAEFQIKYTVLLENTLQTLSSLKVSLSEATTDYFCMARENLEDARYQIILDRIHMTLLPSSPQTRKSFDLREACSLFKPEINGLLDVARRAYAEISQQIEALHRSLENKYSELGRITLTHSHLKGYRFGISLNSGDRKLTENDLPDEFNLVHKSKSQIFFVTRELTALDQRCHQALIEIIQMGNVLIFQLLSDIRKDISCLYNLCEYVAEMDVCLAFARVGQCNDFVRPQFGPQLKLVEARHPILEIVSAGQIVPNSVTMDNEKNFAILTGPNQSGKSIFIRQVALLYILAQVGCYVPAQEATFRIADRIFSRISFDDSIESNASSLLVEMQDIEFIKHNMTPNSVIIIDELCRGTSVEEGTWIALTVCEEFMDSSAFVFFTTHYLFLSRLADMYCNVRNFNFETKIAADENRLDFTHKMLPGVTPSQHYGLKLAEVAGFFDDVLNDARQCAMQLSSENKVEAEVKSITLAYELAQHLMSVLQQNEAYLIEDVKPIIANYKAMYEELNIGPETLKDMERVFEESVGEKDNQRPGQHHMLEENQSESMEIDVNCGDQPNEYLPVDGHLKRHELLKSMEVLEEDEQSDKIQGTPEKGSHARQRIEEETDKSSDYYKWKYQQAAAEGGVHTFAVVTRIPKS